MTSVGEARDRQRLQSDNTAVEHGGTGEGLGLRSRDYPSGQPGTKPRTDRLGLSWWTLLFRARGPEVVGWPLDRAPVLSVCCGVGRRRRHYHRARSGPRTCRRLLRRDEGGRLLRAMGSPIGGRDRAQGEPRGLPAARSPLSPTPHTLTRHGRRHHPIMPPAKHHHAHLPTISIDHVRASTATVATTVTATTTTTTTTTASPHSHPPPPPPTTTTA